MAVALVTNAGIRSSLGRPQPLSPSSSQSLSGYAGAASFNRNGRLMSSSAGVEFGGWRRREDSRSGGGGRRREDCRSVSPLAAIDPNFVALLDLHSFSFLADLIDPHWFDPQLDPAKLPVKIGLNPAREIIEENVVGQLGEEAMKTFYMVWALVFSWGCCVFASMNDEFYESDAYRSAGGNGTGHWIYDQQEREERAAREEMWSEELMKEIEEKAEEVRRLEEKKELEVV